MRYCLGPVLTCAVVIGCAVVAAMCEGLFLFLIEGIYRHTVSNYSLHYHCHCLN